MRKKIKLSELWPFLRKNGWHEWGVDIILNRITLKREGHNESLILSWPEQMDMLSPTTIDRICLLHGITLEVLYSQLSNDTGYLEEYKKIHEEFFLKIIKYLEKNGWVAPLSEPNYYTHPNYPFLRITTQRRNYSKELNNNFIVEILSFLEKRSEDLIREEVQKICIS